MKTLAQNTLTFSILFVFFSGSLFASTDGAPVIPANTMDAIYTILTPATPKETTFNDADEYSDFSFLRPSTPVEAAFENETGNETMLIDKILAPVTPKEAAFDETDFTPAVDYRNLAPVTPAEADFE